MRAVSDPRLGFARRLALGGLILASLAASPPMAAQEPPSPERAAGEASVATNSRTPPEPLADDKDSTSPTRDRLAKEAEAVLDRHCARCHDARRLTRPMPAGGIANILDLPSLASRRDMVRPGHPDGSPLFVSMQTRHMPLDAFTGQRSADEPTAKEVAALRAWISELDSRPVCTDAPAKAHGIARRIEEDVSSLDPAAAKHRRYLSLGHLVEDCAPAETGRKYRPAVVKLLNLLSRKKKPFRPRAVGDDGLLLAFDLDDVGWSEADWEWLEERFTGPPFYATSDEAASRSMARHLVLPADWLAHEAMEANVYARLIDLPPTLPALLAKLEPQGDTSMPTQVYAVKTSPVTGGARAFKRLMTTERGTVWTAADFAQGADRVEEIESEAGAKPIEQRELFMLQNRFPGFALFSRNGMLRRHVHKSVLPAELEQSGAERAGLQCIACHASGLATFESDGEEPGPAPADWQIARDKSLTFLAFRAVGLDPSLKIDGNEPVVALALRYERDLALDTAAAELGLTQERLSKALLEIGGDLQPVARRLLQGLVTRKEFVALSHHLLPIGSSERLTPLPLLSEAAPSFSAEANGELSQLPLNSKLRLSIWTEKEAYEKGDELRLLAAATAPCRLTLISVDSHGDAAVLFPSEFQKDNRLEPGKTVKVPADGDGFRLRVVEPGHEAIIGICLAGDRESPPGMYHHFEVQRFTLLGKWQKHLLLSLLADSAERKQAGASRHKMKLGRKRGGRPKAQLPRENGLPLPQDWAMIVIEPKPEVRGEETQQQPQ